MLDSLVIQSCLFTKYLLWSPRAQKLWLMLIHSPLVYCHTSCDMSLKMGGFGEIVRRLQKKSSPCRCEALDVLFRQRDTARQDWEAVCPGHRTDYAWDQPTGSNKLCICIKDGSAAFRDMTTHEYSLDAVKVPLLLQFH